MTASTSDSTYGSTQQTTTSAGTQTGAQTGAQRTDIPQQSEPAQYGEQSSGEASQQGESYDAERGTDAVKYCTQKPRIPRPTPTGITEDHLSAIVVGRSKWLNGTVLHYYFFGSGDGSPAAWAVPSSQRDAIRTAFATWKGLGLGLEFTEVTSVSEAEIRIGFDESDGSWSYVGRDLLSIPQDERTMNFGWDLTTTYGGTTALHEIGHTLGMPHEHQNPNAGIVWDEEAVYTYLGGAPNFWPREQTFHNVLRKLDAAEVSGSTWDWKSVMEYDFPSGLIISPAQFSGGVHPPGGLSDVDKQYMLSWYPGLSGTMPKLAPFTSTPVSLAPGQQVDYAVTPAATRTYTISTFGESDTVLGLFEDVNGELRFVDGDDDSGEDRNAKIRVKLFKDRNYVVRLRCYYSNQSALTSVMYW
jgi:hypothetical protein